MNPLLETLLVNDILRLTPEEQARADQDHKYLNQLIAFAESDDPYDPDFIRHNVKHDYQGHNDELDHGNVRSRVMFRGMLFAVETAVDVQPLFDSYGTIHPDLKRKVMDKHVKMLQRNIERMMVIDFNQMVKMQFTNHYNSDWGITQPNYI